MAVIASCFLMQCKMWNKGYIMPKPGFEPLRLEGTCRAISLGPEHAGADAMCQGFCITSPV